MKNTEYIIVGQGIAGTLLAFELEKAGKSFVLIDKPGLSMSSKVAGGIYNPVVFKRLTPSWMAETVLPAMTEVYTELENKFGKKILHPIKINRVFSDQAEETLWVKKSRNELAEFLDPVIHQSSGTLGFLKNNYGTVTKAGYVDLEILLHLSLEHFEKKGCFLNEKFDYAGLRLEEDACIYKNISAKKIIFCEGHLASENPWFHYAKFKPAKGELLFVYCPELKLESILTKDIFILPTEKPGHFKVGATYDWNDLTDTTTEAAKEELSEKLSRLIPYPFEVIDQKAGIRPSTIDRRPVIGFHPEKKNLGIFNGFGTKAVMLAPYFAKHFCSFMENKTSLWQEVDVNRFPLTKAEM